MTTLSDAWTAAGHSNAHVFQLCLTVCCDFCTRSTSVTQAALLVFSATLQAVSGRSKLDCHQRSSRAVETLLPYWVRGREIRGRHKRGGGVTPSGASKHASQGLPASEAKTAEQSTSKLSPLPVEGAEMPSWKSPLLAPVCDIKELRP